MSNKYLVLRLEGPMQSWGLHAYFDERTTESLPTKSGVMGILAAAMGIDRKNDEALKELVTLSMSTYCRKEGVIQTDYHTVGSNPYDGGLPVAGKGFSEGKIPEKSAQTYRSYLFDYKFVVVLKGPVDLIDRCAAAVQDPIWGVWLGRKNCIPSAPLFYGTYDTSEEVMRVLQEKLDYKDSARVLSEGDGPESRIERDVPLSFHTRKFGVRRVTAQLVL